MSYPLFKLGQLQLLMRMKRLELDHNVLALAVTAQFKVLASLDDQKLLLRLGAFQTEDDLFGGLSLLTEDGFCLTTETGLFSVVTTLTLSVQRSLTGLVLGNLEGGMLVDRLGEGLSCFWHVDHLSEKSERSVRQSKSDSKMG